MAREEAERIQAEKDKAAELESQRLRDEIEALKNPAPVEEEKVAPRFTDEQVRQIDDACMAIETANILRDAMYSIPPEERYKAAGKAMKAIIGDFQVTKNLLDSIIQGNIPYVIYTGEKA